MTCDQHEIEYWLENGKVRNDDVKARENLACFQANGIDAYIS